MSKLMIILGIVFAAVGIALGLMIFFSPSSVVGWGITPQAAIELLVGGVLAVGIGGIIDAVARIPARTEIAMPIAPPVETQVFVRRAAEVSVPAAAVAAASADTADGLSPATSETIRAIEEARTEIHKAFGEAPPAEPVASPEPPPALAAEPAAEPAPAEEEPEAAAEEDDGQLYVLEEKTVRGRPARILSDGTIEAETEEGWMRFENLEHLNEYLDATVPT